MAVVHFLQYREYEAARIEASNAMMALLAGAQLANHLLVLTAGSSRLLPEVFPRVSHIKRFNLTTDAARDILASADTHLGAMGVPYALAIHEDYMKVCLGLLARASRIRQRTVRDTSAARQHLVVQESTGYGFDPSALRQLQMMRRLRNCLIHEGARASRGVLSALDTWTDADDDACCKIAGRSPRDLSLGNRISFGHGEMLLALAITKTLDREANSALQLGLPRSLWAHLVVEDAAAATPALLRRSDAMRKVSGLSRHYYFALALTEHDIAQAIEEKKRGSGT